MQDDSSTALNDATLIRIESWIAANAGKADPRLWTTAAEATFRRKCFAELSLTLILAEAMGWRVHREPHSPLEAVRTELLARCDNTLVSLARRSPDRLAILSFPLAYACASQHYDADQRRNIRALLSSDFAWGFERLPFRYLDLAVSCVIAGAVPPIQIDTILAVSSLALPPDPVTAHRDAFYGLTHSVFYAYLLNSKPLIADTKLRLAIRGGICRSWAGGDLDLGLELIAAARMCGLDEGDAGRALLAQVAAHVADTGYIPCEMAQASRPFIAVRPDEEIWARSIHTMEVAALALRATACLPIVPSPVGRATGQGADEDIGRLMTDLYRNDFGGAAQKIEQLSSRRHDSDQTALIGHALRHIESSQEDGRFGFMIDERHLMRIQGSDELSYAEHQEDVDAACLHALSFRRQLTAL